MESANNAQQVFEELFKNEENTTCFECGIFSVQWASVNNGIFLCLNCSSQHRCFGAHISLVRHITLDSWSDLQLAMMKNGGNSALKSCFSSYNLPQDQPMEYKYHTKVGVYYREMLKAISQDQQIPTAPSVEEGAQLSPEVDNSAFTGEDASKEKSVMDKVNVEGVKQGAVFFGNTIVSGVKTIATKVNEQANNPNLKNDMVEFGQKVGERTKNAAEAVAEKSKEVWNNRDEIMNKTADSISKGWDSTVSFWKKLTGPKDEANPNPNPN